MGTVSIWVQIWITLVGVTFAIAELFQFYKIYKSKDSSGVSVATWILTLVGQLQWLFYGCYIGDIPLIITNIACVIMSASLVLSIYIFK